MGIGSCKGKTGYADGNQKQDASHGRSSLLFQMAIGAILSNLLSKLQLVQKFDSLWRNQKHHQKGNP